jgi:hypothetical protein
MFNNVQDACRARKSAKRTHREKIRRYSRQYKQFGAGADARKRTFVSADAPLTNPPHRHRVCTLSLAARPPD